MQEVLNFWILLASLKDVKILSSYKNWNMGSLVNTLQKLLRKQKKQGPVVNSFIEGIMC